MSAPITVPPVQRRKSRQGRYHLSDPYFRFYFRFLDPYQDVLTIEPERVLRAVRTGLRAFVGQSAFELLAQTWVRQQGRAGQLPFQPDAVGSHWSRHVQVDVVAINWQRKKILLGECKWTQDPIDCQIVRELIEQKLPKVKNDLPNNGDSWQATLRHIACEGRCFVLGCNQFVTKSMYPADLDGIEDLDNQPEIMSRGGNDASKVSFSFCF